MFERLQPHTTPPLTIKELNMKQVFSAMYLVVFAILILVGGFRGIDYTFDYLEKEHALQIEKQDRQDFYDQMEKVSRK